MAHTRFGFNGQYISGDGGFRVIYTPPLGKLAVLITASLCSGGYGPITAAVGLQLGFSGAVVDIVSVALTTPHAQADEQGEWVLTANDHLYLNTAGSGSWAVNFGGMLYTIH